MKATLKMMLRQYSYQYREEPFLLKSGLQSNHYVDCRPVLLHPEGVDLAARLMRALIHLHVPPIDAVAGVVLGGVPLVDEICSQEYSETDNFWFKAYVRPEAKDHGTKKLIEMDFGLQERLRQSMMIHRKPRVLVVEDVWTTGGSAVRATRVLAENGFDVVATVVLVDREEPETERPSFSIFTLDELNS